MKDKKTKSGMYGETPRIIIGEFTISESSTSKDNSKIWIEHQSGEGGDFSKKDFEKVLETFYNINF